ncbi:50S ribosomal protein L21 [Reinekea sp. G2M2-21]|uniref:50S ribosomal protein L21 n=1 Tax=Reinekea sp. G2M2-21 TaxID=2788942 RepID=UPI0018AB756A|nr:50S ribosomal protein L21 [Reinekea sp. G2M2-21]MDX1341361.1 50S ribosomal protein L21 [Reinekea sp.]MDX1474035.1 50S ribosomal protein L21 [Reinekea sp.]
MYAVIVSGGKQYRVSEGQTLKLEKIEAETGASINFDKVLLVADGDKFNIGQPVVKGAVVSAEIIAQGRHKKVKIMKFKRRKHHMKQMGHRQWFTEVKITGIKA